MFSSGISSYPNVSGAEYILAKYEKSEVFMKVFNTAGVCDPEIHYMVNTDDKLFEIKALVDRNQYFVINRPRQFGKTTTLLCFTRF
jgi:hypothetical protein